MASPTITVAELLELPVVRRARPEVVTGAPDDLARPVRWVHTSEIYEISPLLKGGEVLLTTGLGLVGLSPSAVRSYVASLHGTGVAALFLELGRTFTQPPPVLVEAARTEGLTLVALHGVVPFIEITETVHPLLIGGEVDRLRAGAVLAERLVGSMVAGAGLPAMVACFAEAAASPAELRSVAGDVIAGTAGAAGDRPLDGDVTVVPVAAGGTELGSLRFAGALDPGRRAVVEGAVGLLALEMQRTHPQLPSLDQAGATLFAEILDGRYPSVAELNRRAAGVGLVLGAGQRAMALCLLVADSGRGPFTALAAARTGARRVFGPSLVTAVDDSVLVATAVHARDVRRRLGDFAATVRAELELATTGRFVVSAGPLVDELAELDRSVAAARETAVLARRLSPSAETVLADDFALYQLIAGLVEDAALERFVDEQIGPLLEFDARTGAELVRTLDTYLSCGMSKSAAATALGVRRQTLYGRLERISALLGGFDLDHRERRTAIDLALVGWRLRTAAATR